MPISAYPKGDLLSLFAAAARGSTDMALSDLRAEAIAHALDCGLGPMLARATRDGIGGAGTKEAEAVRASELTARVLNGELLDALESILAAARSSGCTPLTIKGAAVCQLYYDEPHLRTMGDIDFFVSKQARAALEEALLRLGYRQRSNLPAAFYQDHHHSMPFWHPERRIWVEVHTRLTRSIYPMAQSPLFAHDHVMSQSRLHQFRGQRCYLMRDELQLLYLCARWAEEFDVERGLVPMMDVMLLCRRRGSELDWERVLSFSRGPAAAAVHLMLGFLSRHGLIEIPAAALAGLSKLDTGSNPLIRSLLHRLIQGFLMAGKPFGPLASEYNVQIVWGALLAPGSPVLKLLRLPTALLAPPGDRWRFSLPRVYQRLRSAITRDTE